MNQVRVSFVMADTMAAPCLCNQDPDGVTFGRLPAATVMDVAVVGIDNALGEFLKARRALVRPEDVGVPDAGRRRVPGLRRDELAMLAGVSEPYLVRLEQGGTAIPPTRCSTRSPALCGSTPARPRTCTSSHAAPRGPARVAERLSACRPAHRRCSTPGRRSPRT
jgi:hypothetical protein